MRETCKVGTCEGKCVAYLECERILGIKTHLLIEIKPCGVKVSSKYLNMR